MTDTGHDYVLPDQLRLGLHVELEVGWMAHPFPTGSFKISSERQIETLRGLGFPRIRVVPSKSDPATEPFPAAPDAAIAQGMSQAQGEPVVLTFEQERRQRLQAVLDAQRGSLAACDQRFGAAIRGYESVLDQIQTEPAVAATQCRELVHGLVAAALDQAESSIRLLSEGMGDQASLHPVNVTVLSLLLGKALGLAAGDLQALGIGAFLHDIGKSQLPERVRWMDSRFSSADCRAHQDHVAHGLLLAKRLDISGAALRAMAEHHELMDASGFPRRLPGDAISLPGKILALVNRYDNMCNPARPADAVTPHEALSLVFSQMKARYDGAVLAAFIRMMGVYPPGSVVQLSNGLYALVVSVNSSRPLKPRVLVHDPVVPREEAQILDLEGGAAPGIRRSVRPVALPRAAVDYLSPRTRICYFFEHAIALSPAQGSA